MKQCIAAVTLCTRSDITWMVTKATREFDNPVPKQIMTHDKAEAASSLHPPAEGAKTGPWDISALAKFREWDPAWVDQCLKMSNNPWTGGILPRKDSS